MDTPDPVPPSGTFKANERDSTVDICVSVDPDLQDNAEDLSYAGRLTRGQAAFRGINVEDYPLPAHCLSLIHI